MRRPRCRGRWILGALFGLGAGALLLDHTSPWPRALLVRHRFTRTGTAKNAALASRVPAGIASVLDRQYAEGDRDARLDVYYPSSLEGSPVVLPTIVWVHGGAWLAGDKAEVANYCKILAGRGFTVAAINYALAPRATHPRPVAQLGEALTYLQANAAALHIDTQQILLAGDSAGAQIASQYGNVVTNPGYAGQLGIRPALQATQLRGLILLCGAYDAEAVHLKGALGGFQHVVMWSYAGRRDFRNDPRFALLSTKNYVTAAYPAAFIAGGNADPLTPQSKALAARLGALGVPVDSLFFPDDHEPALPHEYQFDLSTDAARETLERIVAFAAGRVAAPR